MFNRVLYDGMYKIAVYIYYIHLYSSGYFLFLMCVHNCLQKLGPCIIRVGFCLRKKKPDFFLLASLFLSLEFVVGFNNAYEISFEGFCREFCTHPFRENNHTHTHTYTSERSASCKRVYGLKTIEHHTL